MARSVVIDILARDNASATLSRVGASADLAAARFTRAGDKMIATSRSLNRHLTLPILAIGAAAVKMSTDFSSAMTRIQTQAGGSARDVQYLTKQVLAMKGAQQGPVELANGLYHLKSVGMGNVQAMKALRQASDLAAVGHANLEDTVNALAGAWRTGIRGAKDFHGAVAEINAIIGSGNMHLPDVIGALGTGILPTAKTFGLTLKDVGSALALFTDEGVPADMAATRLRMTFSLLGAPTGKAQKQLKSIGITQYELANDMRKHNGLLVAVQDLKKHLDNSGLSATRQAALLSRAFGGGRSSSAILSMVNNVDVLGKKYAQNTRLVHQFNDAVKTQRATPEAKFKLLEASLSRAMVLLGNQLLPLAVKAADKLASMAEKFNGLSSGWRKFIAYGALGVAALGPVLAIGGRLVKVFTLLWRVQPAAARFISGQTAAQRSMQATATTATATGTAVQASSAKMDVAALRVQASQLSQQAAVKRSAALFAVAESEKARAAVVAAEEIANAAQAAGGAEAVLAARTASDARLFAAAKAAEADAAVAAAAKITTASVETTRALGRAQMAQGGFMARNAGKMRGASMGLGLGLGIALPMVGSKVGGPGGGAISGAGYGAMLGSMFGPEGLVIGGGLGALLGMASGLVTDKASFDAPPSTSNKVTHLGGSPGRAGGGYNNAAAKASLVTHALTANVLALKNAYKVAAREQELLTANTDRYGKISKHAADLITSTALATSGLAKVAAKYKYSTSELTVAVTGTNDEYARMRTLLNDAGASPAALKGFDAIRRSFQNGTGAGKVLNDTLARMKARMDAIKTAMDLGTLKMSTSAAESQLDTLNSTIAFTAANLANLNNITIHEPGNTGGASGVKSSGAASYLPSAGPFKPATNAKPGVGNNPALPTYGGGGSGSGGGGGGGSGKAPFDTSAIGTAIGNIGSAGSTKPIDLASVGITRIQRQIQHAWAVLSAAQSRGLSKAGAASFAAEIRSLAAEAQKQLRALRVKIRTSDLTAIRTALRGTVDDTRTAFTQMFSDLRAIGAGAVNSALRSGEQRLIALQNKMSNARDYQSGVRSTLAGTFDATKYGSVQDLLGGLAGQTSQNKSYTSEVNKLRREAKGNKGLLAFINQLAATGQTATLQTLAGASKGQLAQVAKAVGGYNESLTKGSQAAELAKFGESVKQMTKEQGHLVHVLAEILHSVLAHPLQAHISKKEIDDEIAGPLNELKNLLQGGRKSG